MNIEKDFFKREGNNCRKIRLKKITYLSMEKFKITLEVKY